METQRCGDGQQTFPQEKRQRGRPCGTAPHSAAKADPNLLTASAEDITPAEHRQAQMERLPFPGKWERLCLPAWASRTTSTAAVRAGRRRSWVCSPPTAAAAAWPAPWWWAGGCPHVFWACSCCRSAVVPVAAPAAAPAASGSGGGRTPGISLSVWFAWEGGFAALRNLAGPQLLRRQSYRRSLHP